MSIRNLLVFIDDAEDANRRLDTAIALAVRLDAHITVLAVTAYASFHQGYHSVEGSKLYFKEMKSAHFRAKELSQQAQAYLVERGRSGDVRWASDKVSGVPETAAIHARYADLCLLSKSAEEANERLRDAIVSGVLFDSGRPAVLLPRAWHGGFGARILVAWEPTSQAARAVGDALSFIGSGTVVNITMIDPAVSPREYGEEPGSNIATSLSRHGATVTVDRIPSSGKSVAETLLAHADAIGADLIVMGGYSHSRVREALIGGVTHEMIATTRLPTLISH